LILEPGFVSISNEDIDLFKVFLSPFRIPESRKFLMAGLA